MRPLRALALVAMLAAAATVASAETEWCAARRKACERSCGSAADTDFDCKDKGGNARSVSCSCTGSAGGGAVAGPVFAGDPTAALNNPAVDMLKGIGAWPSGAFNGGQGSYDASKTPAKGGAAQQTPATDAARPASNSSPSNPAYLSGAPGGSTSKSNDVGKAVGIAVGVTAAACAAIAAAALYVSRRRAAAAASAAALPLAMPPPKSVD